ncbi:IS30 family transposase, partial [Bifidobacterium longum]
MKVQHPLDWKLPRKPVRRDVAPMGEVYSHLSEEERQVIQIEVGNGASIRGIG